MAFITPTETKDYKPLLRFANYPWEVLRALFINKLGSEFELLLAEPVFEPGRGRTDWYVDSSEPVTLAADLDPTARTAIFERLRSMRERVHNLASQIENPTYDRADRNLANAIRRAVIVPEDSKFVWAAGGNPILVAWGSVYRYDERSIETIFIDVLPRRRGQDDSKTGGGTTISEPPPVDPIVPVRRSSWLRPAVPVTALLWLLFAGLIGSIYFLLLQACGILVAPENSWLSRYLPASCYSVAIADPLGAERDRRAELERKIRDAEFNIVRSAADCPPLEQQTQIQPSVPPAAAEVRKPQRPPIIANEKPVAPQQPKPDELHISLSWKGLEDLDLYVRCPGGTLSLGSLNNEECGGKLDGDMNNRGANADAVENATWKTAPKGKYEIMVKFFSRKSQPERAVPFVVGVRRGNNMQTFDGSASEVGAMVSVHSFNL